MNALVQFARELGTIVFAQHPLPRFDQLLWLVVCRVSKLLAAAANNRRQLEQFRDYLNQTLEGFVTAYFDQLQCLEVDDRKLLLRVKFRISFVLDTRLPAGDSSDETSGCAVSRTGEPTRVFYTVATLVPTVGDLASNACSCKQRGSGAHCHLCSRPENPYDPPDPQIWYKQQMALSGRGDCDKPVAGFRAQRLQSNVEGLVKESVRRSRTASGVTANIEKFTSTQLPDRLRGNKLDLDLSLSVAALESQGRIYEDLAALASHFATFWAIIHYLEPRVIPPNGDR